MQIDRPFLEEQRRSYAAQAEDLRIQSERAHGASLLCGFLLEQLDRELVDKTGPFDPTEPPATPEN